MRPCAALLLAMTAAWSAVGDVPTGRPVKAWEPAIAALTDPRPVVNSQAIDALIHFGDQVLDDLAVLQSDADWQVRSRLATVGAGIGGERAVAMVVAISRDSDPRVREIAALALGKCPRHGVCDRLRQMLGDAQPVVRKSAAMALDDLGDPAGLLDLAGYAQEKVEMVRLIMRTSLLRLAVRPQAVAKLAILIGTSKGPVLWALLEASAGVGDPRLSSVLASLLGGDDQRAAVQAAVSLSANGDSLAIAALCTVAADDHRRELSATAASTLRRLTGFNAEAGPAWKLWWDNHAGDVAALAERDRFIGDCHDPQRKVERAELAKFSPDQLMPLVDGCLGQGAYWWPARAWDVLAGDEPGRWTAPLIARIRNTFDANQRLALIMILDELSDPGALQELRKLLADEKAEDAKEAKLDLKPRGNPQRVVLEAAIARRGAGPPPSPGEKVRRFGN